LNKAEKKLLKLQTKAEKCLTREKAQKVLKKFDKKVQRGFITPHKEKSPIALQNTVK